MATELLSITFHGVYTTSMGLKRAYETNVIRKISKRFIRQQQYAGRVLYATFADELDKQFESNSEESKEQKLLLEVAINQLLGNPLSDLNLNESQRKLIWKNMDTVEQFKSEMMGSQPDIREFVVQTARMLFFLDMMTTTNSKEFLKSPQGETLTEILSEYGGEYPQVTPSMYDQICESVALKTNTVSLYHSMLKGKQP